MYFILKTILHVKRIFYIRILRCSVAWPDPDSASFVIYMFTLGYSVPNFIIIYTSVHVVMLHKKVL